MDEGGYTSWDELAAARREWVEVRLVEAEHGGWDIALRLDGAYMERDEAEQMRAYWKSELGRLIRRLD